MKKHIVNEHGAILNCYKEKKKQMRKVGVSIKGKKGR
jgi:hypothetical protein